MDINNNISIDLVNLLIFTMPGFFFVRAFSKKQKTDFEYLMLSMFWGILLLIVIYNILPTERFIPLFGNPYAGAIVFSILGYLLGIVINLVKRRIRHVTT